MMAGQVSEQLPQNVSVRGKTFGGPSRYEVANKHKGIQGSKACDEATAEDRLWHSTQLNDRNRQSEDHHLRDQPGGKQQNGMPCRPRPPRVTQPTRSRDVHCVDRHAAQASGCNVSELVRDDERKVSNAETCRQTEVKVRESEEDEARNKNRPVNENGGSGYLAKTN
jgi:hypothetical protein